MYESTSSCSFWFHFSRLIFHFHLVMKVICFLLHQSCSSISEHCKSTLILPEVLCYTTRLCPLMGALNSWSPTQEKTSTALSSQKEPNEISVFYLNWLWTAWPVRQWCVREGQDLQCIVGNDRGGWGALFDTWSASWFFSLSLVGVVEDALRWNAAQVC